MKQFLGHLIHVLATALVANTCLAQWTFRLDTTFCTSIVDRNVNAIAVLDDGGLFLSGRMRFPGDLSYRGSAKLLTNGQRDINFPQFPNTTGGGSRVVTWNGTHIYVSNGLVRRLFSNGLLDPSFISMNTGPYFHSVVNGDYHVYPDGRILMSGSHHLSDTARGFVGAYDLIWFSNEGYLDTTRTHRRGNGVVYQFEALPNGQFICSGTCTEFEGEEVDWIFRVNADGSTDTTFRTGVYWGGPYDYHPLDDGRVYAAGSFMSTQATNDTLRLVRFLADGTLDPSFVRPHFSDGAYDWPFGAEVTHVRSWYNGTLMVCGQFQYVNGQLRKGICLIDSTGQLLDAFDSCGVEVFQDAQLPKANINNTLYDSTNAHLYVCGVYNGYNDGTINDAEQRFVSRLLVEEVSVGVQEVPPLPGVSPSLAGGGVTLDLYPNPASDRVTVQRQQPTQPGKLVLRDALGRVVHQQRLSTSSTVIDLLAHPDGLYFVEVRYAGGQRAVQRLVVQH